MYARKHCEPGLIIQSHTPGASTAAGAVVTPGNNTYGSYVQVQGALAEEAYEVWINFNGVALSGSAKDCLVTIGIDVAGGTSYVDWIVDLSASCASLYSSSAGGISYTFPLKVPKGASLAAKGTVNNATVGTINVQMRFKCLPSRPEMVRAGTYVRTFGSVPASSGGTAITPGANAEGSWTQLGTVAAGDYLWAWCLGPGVNNAAMNTATTWFDLGIGDASNKRQVIVDQGMFSSTIEAANFTSQHALAQANPGDIVYARAWGVSTQNTGQSAIAYGVGG